MNEENLVSYLPIEIDLLFDNKKLDVLKYLGILYYAKVKTRKRKFTIEHLLYYYTLLYYENNNTKIPLIYKYYRDKERINQLLIYLENLNFVEVHGNVSLRQDKLQVTITELGLQSIESWQTDNILVNFEQISNIIEKYPYKNININFQKLLYVGEF